MTCEVIVLNRLGAALAADSAVTFQGSSPDTATFATGANKIFQLSETEPVAAMIFSQGTLQGAPWELILKSFRRHLGRKTFPSVQDYALSLKSFIADNRQLFPTVYRTALFHHRAARAAGMVIEEIKKHAPELWDSTRVGQHVQGWALAEANVRKLVDSFALPAHFIEQNVREATHAEKDPLSREVENFFRSTAATAHIPNAVSCEAISEIAIQVVFKLYASVFDDASTGVVLVGYGAQEYFPSYASYRYYGFVRDVLVVDGESAESITHERGSIIEAFAKKSMVETFMRGYGPGAWDTVQECFLKGCADLATDLMARTNVAAAPPGWEQTVSEMGKQFSHDWTSKMLDLHYVPLKTIVSGLAIDEMAGLAETLVLLESLKERVTARTQSVGGPIDVAVITKAEGLVWLKRKLYFDPSLNNRYFQRQQLAGDQIDENRIEPRWNAHVRKPRGRRR